MFLHKFLVCDFAKPFEAPLNICYVHRARVMDVVKVARRSVRQKLMLVAM